MNVNFLNIFQGVEHFLLNASTGHICDGTDDVFCNFCGEVECEDECFFSELKHISENLNTIPYERFKKAILEISKGMIVSTVCSHIFVDFCAYCGEEEHEEDCLYTTVVSSIGLINETYRKDVETFLNSDTCKTLFNDAVSEYTK